MDPSGYYPGDGLDYYIQSGVFDSNPYYFKVETLEKKVETLTEEIKVLREMVDAMWYKPAGVNMPGFNQMLAEEIEKKFENFFKK
jgi:hypothetical protein